MSLLSVLAGTGIASVGDLVRTVVHQNMAEKAQQRVSALKALLEGLPMESPQGQMAAAPTLSKILGFDWPTTQMSPEENVAAQNAEFLKTVQPSYPAGSATPIAQAEQTGADIAAKIPTTRLAGLVPSKLEDLIVKRMEPEVTGKDLLGMRYKTSEFTDFLKLLALQQTGAYREKALDQGQQKIDIAKQDAETNAAIRAITAQISMLKAQLMKQQFTSLADKRIADQAKDLLDKAEIAKNSDEALNHYRGYYALRNKYPHLVPDITVPDKYLGIWDRWINKVDITARTKKEALEQNPDIAPGPHTNQVTPKMTKTPPPDINGWRFTGQYDKRNRPIYESPTGETGVPEGY